MDLEFVRTLKPILGMVVMRHMNTYHQLRVNVRLAWLKVVRPRHLKKGRFFKSFQKTPSDLIRMEKNQEDLNRRGLNIAVPYVRFISVREELVGKSILSCLNRTDRPGQARPGQARTGRTGRTGRIGRTGRTGRIGRTGGIGRDRQGQAGTGRTGRTGRIGRISGTGRDRQGQAGIGRIGRTGRTGRTILHVVR
jgi:hypothetical protein